MQFLICIWIEYIEKIKFYKNLLQAILKIFNITEMYVYKATENISSTGTPAD